MVSRCTLCWAFCGDFCAQVAVEKKGKGAKTKLVAKTGGATVRQWDIMKMMVPGETDSLQQGVV